MDIRSSRSTTIRPQSSFLLFVLVLGSFLPVHGQESATALIDLIKAVPSVYFTPEAYSYYSRAGQTLPPQPPHETATKAYRTALSIVDQGGTACNFILDLIELFPKVVHVTEIRNIRYSGEGTFEDWLMTYLMSEKNKFILSSPVLDYNSMTLCEPYITSTHQVDFIDKATNPSGSITAATVNVTVIFTLYIGECALTKITKAEIGNEQQNWRNWYEQNSSLIRTSGNPGGIPNKSGTLAGGQLFGDVLVKGTYRMVLTTGDELTGVVEFKSDTTLILETTDGKPYTFRHSLIRRYELLQRPQIHLSSNPTGEKNARLELTFDELRQAGVAKLELEVVIASGTTFKGTIDTIDESMLRINVEGSKIPISREAVRRISLIPPKASDGPASPKGTDVSTQSLGLQDTLVIKNKEVDEWGKQKPDYIFSGVLKNSNDTTVAIRMADGSIKTFSRTDILRIIKNSKDDSNEPVIRYARPLYCPDDMFLVDMPPGKQGKPFFKVCIDRYEFPNKKEVVPKVGVSFTEAKNFCESQGKRLCTSDEWQWGCSGLEGYAYPYGWNREENKCNTDGTRSIEPSGVRHNCVSKFGGYDMTGNIFEWVSGSGSEPALMGGSYSKCQTVSPGLDGSSKPQIGLRCCKSN